MPLKSGFSDGLGGVFMVINCLGFKPTWNALLISRLLVYFPFFVFGLLIKEYYSYIRTYVENRLVASLTVSVLIFAITVFCMHLGVFNGIPYVVPFFICCSLWVWSVALSFFAKRECIFTYFGINSLQYYLNHLLIMLLCFYVGAFCFSISPLLSLFVVYLLALLISTIMLQIEKRFSWLRFLCGFN